MIETRKDETVTVVLRGRLDSMNADEAKSEVEKVLAALDRDVLIDVGELDYISSAGLQVVLKCAKTARERGFECLLRGARGTVREIFEVSGFLTFLKEAP